MRLRLSLLIVFVCLPITIFFGQWQPMGPPGGDFRVLARAPGSDNTVYLASNNSPSCIWRTTDNGDSWGRVGSINATIYSLAVDPTNASILYAGGSSYIYRSTNAGSTWTQLSKPSSHYYFYGLTVHPTTPATVLTGCYVSAGGYYRMGFMKSTNSGGNWTSETLSVDTSYAYALAIDPTDPDNIYVGGYKRVAGVYSPIVFKSTDGGSGFNSTGVMPVSGSYCYSLIVHQTNSNYVYAGNASGVCRSTDGSASWTKVSTGSYNYSLTTTPANPSLLYSGGVGYIYRSTDAGATWTSHNIGLSGSTYYGVAASRTAAASVCAANNIDFFRSANTGANWEKAHNGLNGSPVTAMANAPSRPSRIYVDNDGNSQYRSTDNGATWMAMTKPLSCGSLCDFAVAYDNPDYVLEFEGSG